MVKTISYPQLPLRTAEIARYARCDYEQARIQIDEAAAGICEAAFFRVCYDVFPVTRSPALLDLGFTATGSKDLMKCLKTSENVLVFAATAGVGVDRLIQKYSRLSPSKAIFLNAAGSEAVEALCDRFCRDMEPLYGTLCPRYSPGYGDLPLTIQTDIFAALSCTRNIGVSLSDGFLMTPTKSVTAIVGLLNNTGPNENENH